MRNGRQDGNSDVQPILVSSSKSYLQLSPPTPEHFHFCGTVECIHVAQIRDAGFSLDSIGLGRVEIPNVVL